MNDELAQYATDLILDRARDVEYLMIFEAAAHHLGREIGESEAQQVERFIRTARITVEFPGGES